MNQHSIAGKKMMRILFAVFVVISVCCIAEVLVELCVVPKDDFRVFKEFIQRVENDIYYPFIQFDRVLMWRNLPFFKANVRLYDTLNMDLTIDEWGLRRQAQNISLKKDGDTLRIMCLGDSITFGLGVDDGHTYSYLLARLLQERYPSRTIEVLNAGVTGYTSFQGLLFYKYFAGEFATDIITVCYGANDFLKKSQYSDKEIALKSPEYRRFEHIFDRLIIWNHLREHLVPMVEKYKQALVPRVGVEEYEDNIEEIISIALKRNNNVVIIATPQRFTGDTVNFLNYLQPYKAALKLLAQKYRIPLLEIKDLSPAAQFDNSRYFWDSVHTTHEGNVLIAEKLFDALHDAGVISDDNE